MLVTIDGRTLLSVEHWTLSVASTEVVTRDISTRTCLTDKKTYSISFNMLIIQELENTE